MNKKDLKTGTIVELRNGDQCIVLLDGRCEPNDSVGLLCDIKDGQYIDIDDYNDDLLGIDCFNEYDILALKKFDCISDALLLLIKGNKVEEGDWDWVRDSEEVKNELPANQYSLSIGDYVIADNQIGWKRQYGKIIDIDTEDTDGLPYLVQFGDNGTLWCQDTNKNEKYYITKEEE